MVIIVDSKVYFYHALQRQRPITEMFPMIIRDISSVKTDFKVTQKVSTVVFAGDYGKSSYRTALYPKYKGHREYSEKQVRLQEHYLGVIPRVAESLGMVPVFVPEVEADDIAGILSRVASSTFNEEIVLLTADHDWRQLVLRLNNVYLKTPRYSRLQDRDYIKMVEGVEDHLEFLLKKSFVGDISDNIKGLKYCSDVRYNKFMKEIKAAEHYDEWDDVMKFNYIISRLHLLPNAVRPHEFYKGKTMEEALRINMKLSEILTSTHKLTKEQKEVFKSYFKILEDSFQYKRKIIPDIDKANNIIEEFMPDVTNDFGGPATIPEAYSAMLHLAVR